MITLEDKLKQFEEDIFEGKDVDLKQFYRLKKNLIDSEEHRELLELHMILETMLDKQQNELMNNLVHHILAIIILYWGMGNELR